MRTINVNLDKETLDRLIKKCGASSKKWLKEFEVFEVNLSHEFETNNGKTYKLNVTFTTYGTEVNLIGGEDVTSKTVH